MTLFLPWLNDSAMTTGLEMVFHVLKLSIFHRLRKFEMSKEIKIAAGLFPDFHQASLILLTVLATTSIPSQRVILSPGKKWQVEEEEEEVTLTPSQRIILSPSISYNPAR